MEFHRCEIKHSDTSECYELTIDGKFYGSYDTMIEAAKEFDAIIEEEAKAG